MSQAFTQTGRTRFTTINATPRQQLLIDVMKLVAEELPYPTTSTARRG
jgi:hypothetical protein